MREVQPAGAGTAAAAAAAGGAAAGGAAGGAGGAPAAASALPEPPAEPLPPLSSLTKARPSPALSWHLLDILYAYCFVLLRYNGAWREAAPEAAGQLLQLSAALAPPAAAGAAARPQPGCGSGAGEQAAPPPEFASGAACLSACLARVVAPPAGDASLKPLALGSLQQLPQLLQHGRPPVLLALADAQRMVQACQGEVEQQAGEGSAAPAAAAEPKQQRRGGAAARTRAQLRACQAAARKLHFMLAWANEQPDQHFGALAQLAAAEFVQHAQQGGQAAQQSGGAGSGAALQHLADGSEAVARQVAAAAARPQQHQAQAPARALIQEL